MSSVVRVILFKVEKGVYITRCTGELSYDIIVGLRHSD